MRIERLEDLPQTGLPVHYLTQDSNEKHDSEGTVGQWQVVCVALCATEVFYPGLFDPVFRLRNHLPLNIDKEKVSL